MRRAVDFGFRISDCGFSQSQIPQSAIRNPQSPATPRGISLTEVLIAMGILTVGLLGVMSMFPVGSYYMVEAEKSDRSSAIARSVMNDVIARGILDPQVWRLPIITTFTGGPARYVVDGPVASYPQNSYMRPVGPAMAEEMASAAFAGLPRNQQQSRLVRRFGSAYILDPMGVGTATVPAAPVNRQMAAFPAEAYLMTTPIYGGTAWQPWIWAGYGGDYWPVKRVTLAQSLNAIANISQRMDSPIAWSMFNGTDDLVFDLPEQGDRPGDANVGYYVGRFADGETVGGRLLLDRVHLSDQQRCSVGPGHESTKPGL